MDWWLNKLKNHSGFDGLRIGLIGAGRIGAMHARILARDIPGISLAAVAGGSSSAAADLGSELAVPNLEPHVLIQREDVDAVAICSSTETHVAYIVEAAKAGKAIFCEKPLSLELVEVDRALAAVEAAGVPFMVGFNRRFDPHHLAVREALDRGDVGEPHIIRISSRDPAPPPVAYARGSGGIFLDMAIHDFDMARFLARSEVREVYAHGVVRIEPEFATFGDVDTAVTTLVHEDGCYTVIDNSRKSLYGFDQRVEVFGSKGMASLDNFPLTFATMRSESGLTGPPLPKRFIDRYYDSYVNEWRGFAAFVLGGKESPAGPEDARFPLAIAIAATRSMREHRPVSMSEIL